MKKTLLTAAAVLALSLTACADRNDTSTAATADTSTASSTAEGIGNKDNEKDNGSSQAVTSYDLREPTDMPVISIVTEDQSAAVLDFVTEPVAGHVSAAIASWTPGYRIPPEPYYEKCSVTVTDTDGTLLVDAADAEVKVRGNWTTTYDKKPLRIKFGKKQSMLGLNGGSEYRNWVLLACYKDGSLLRDKTALQVAREILGARSLYASDAEFAEVEINGEYWGVYLLAEQQQINEGRVDITDAEKDCEGTDIGYFLEFDGYYVNEPELQSFHVDYAENAPLVPFDGNDGSSRTMTCLSTGYRDYKTDLGFTIKNDLNSQEQHDYIAGFVNNAYKIMYYAAYEDKAYVMNADCSDITETDDITSRQAVENVVDVYSLADMYIISELTCDADIYLTSFFMTADFGADGNGKLTFQAPWDFDSSMGNKNRCADGTGFYAANIIPDVNGGPDVGGYETINPWLAVLMYEDWFQDIIREEWTNAYDSGVFERAAEMIVSDTEAHSKSFANNYKKWNNLINNNAYAGELSDGAAACKTQAEAAEYLSEWFTARVDFLNGYWHE
ncbi:MAG: CotH kinase family protein [Ruminococcus sp.]|nr:CotH kinase family protein [Ruminococcus sp.]